LDAFVLARRQCTGKTICPETGSALVDFVMENVGEQRIYILNIGYAEVVSVLVRKKNAGTLSASQFAQAMLNLDKEVLNSHAFSPWS
jgi:hypothetical protein